MFTKLFFIDSNFFPMFDFNASRLTLPRKSLSLNERKTAFSVGFYLFPGISTKDQAYNPGWKQLSFAVRETSVSWHHMDQIESLL